MESAAYLRVHDFHDLRLGYSADRAIALALDARLGSFAECDAGPCDVRFDYVANTDVARSPSKADSRVVYESEMGKVHYSEGADQMHISTVWPIRAICNPRSGETTISVDGPTYEHSWALSHPLVTLPLIETLKRRGRYSLHAASLAVNGRGLVIPGSSGSGKSTLALALARAGFGYLGDDMVFLERSASGLRALAFPEALDVTDDTVRLFPELSDLLETEKQLGWLKRQLRVEDRFGTEVVWQCQPVALVLPRIAGRVSSTLTPMDPREALLEIVPNILLTEPASSQNHLDVLTELVSSCSCFRLETGTDFDKLAAVLRSLLEVLP